jgi:hypothetical protein
MLFFKRSPEIYYETLQELRNIVSNPSEDGF